MSLPNTRRLNVTFVILMAALCSPLLAFSQTENAPLAQAFERLDAFVAQSMREHGTPGVAIAITDREHLVKVLTYGYADVKLRTPVTPATLFEIGSISKSFTAICLLQLRESGKIDFQQPVGKYLPWFSVHTKFEPITAHHLLTHTSGLPRDRDDIVSSPYQAAAVAERWTGYPPGKKYAYSNIGFQILGYLLGELDGRPSYESVRARIFEPLGIVDSVTAFRNETRRRMAIGYVPFYDDRPHHLSHGLVEGTWGEYGAGDGAIAATPADLATYLRMLLDRGVGPKGRILSLESFALLTRKAIATDTEGEFFYGYGMRTWQDGGHTMIAHSGGMVGYSSRLEGDLDEGIGAIVFVNGPGSPDDIARYAINVLRAARHQQELPPLPPANDPLQVKNAADYAGTFAAPDGKKLTFVARGESLILQAAGGDVVLERRGANSFYANSAEFSLFLLRFGRQGQEKEAANGGQASPSAPVVEVSYGWEWYAGQRYAGPREFETPKQWLAYPGHYRSYSPWISNYRIGLRKGRLYIFYPEGGESVLVPIEGGEFQIGEGPTAERVRFESEIDGKTLRLNISGVDLFRTFTP